MHPILFSLGPLTLRSYGLMMALGFLAGMLLAARLYRRSGKNPEAVYDITAWIMVGGIVGARLMYVAVQPGEFADQPWAVIAIWQGGMVYYGGLIGACLAAWLWERRHHAGWGIIDALTPGLALGQALGRVGCFLNGCCYGRESAGCGLVFPGMAHPVLPVQLYEAGACLLLATGLAWLHGRRHRTGQVFALYLLAYACLRFCLEFLRGDVERGTLLGLPWLSPGQWTSLLVLAAGLVLLKRLKPAA
jgi:phosphatidylglycerol:prolipoprotein diacylglycerol transferase